MANKLCAAKDSIADFLVELMKIDSTTGKEGRFHSYTQNTTKRVYLGELASVIKEFMETEGWHVTSQPLSSNPQRSNLLITKMADSNPKLLFNTHLDTVPPYLAPKVDQGGTCIRGRGSNDAKG